MGETYRSVDLAAEALILAISSVCDVRTTAHSGTERAVQWRRKIANEERKPSLISQTDKWEIEHKCGKGRCNGGVKSERREKTLVDFTHRQVGDTAQTWKGTRKREEELHELMTLEEYTETHKLENDGGKGHDLRPFTYSSILAATNSFSSESKLGEGGFGPVYKNSEGLLAILGVTIMAKLNFIALSTKLAIIPGYGDHLTVNLIGVSP
ncbi:unnamed protein product [Fraxinus pennsylvanica]|uniref:Uncharacterized protein n=1 Tax=Fraxinus pennsylvanica TaxID=56036 RepID=A0AAD2DPR6_9LAMI|nr:unnamed protein product [Fraxinus pennsylvanica]